MPFEISGGLVAGIVFVLLVGLLALGKAVAPGFFAIFVLAWLAYAVVFLVAVVVVPFFEDNAMWGIGNGVAVFFGIGILLPLWYVLVKTDAEWLKYMAGVLVLTIVGFLALGGPKALDDLNAGVPINQTAPAGAEGETEEP